MAIRDRFRRAVRSSISSSSDNLSNTDTISTVGEATTTTITATPTTTSSENSDNDNDSPSLSLQKTQSRLARTFTWGTSATPAEKEARQRAKEEKRLRKEEERNKKRYNYSVPLHPRDRPLTLQNLKHQEMLSDFTMTFGRSPNKFDNRPRFSLDSGISPCCSRPGSVDDGYGLSPVTSRNGMMRSAAEPPTVATVDE